MKISCTLIIDEVGMILQQRIDIGATIISLNEIVYEARLLRLNGGLVQ